MFFVGCQIKGDSMPCWEMKKEKSNWYKDKTQKQKKKKAEELARVVERNRRKVEKKRREVEKNRREVEEKRSRSRREQKRSRKEQKRSWEVTEKVEGAGGWSFKKETQNIIIISSFLSLSYFVLLHSTWIFKWLTS